MGKFELLEREKEAVKEIPQPEDVYDRFHIRKELLKKFALDEKIPPVYRNEIEKHFRTGNCGAAKGNCLEMIEKFRDEDKRKDWRRSQLPPSDRD